MADTIQAQHTTSGANLYALVRAADGTIWNGAALEAYLTANLGNYDLPMTEQGTASRFYAVNVPALAAGWYSAQVYVRAGGAPAETDTLVGVGDFEWTGSAFVKLGAPAGASVSADIAAVKTQTAAIEVDTQDLQSRTPAALVGGRIDANVGAISGDATAADNLEAATDGTGYNIGNGSVVAASVTGAVGSVTGNVGGNVTGSVGSVGTGGITAASLAADAITAAKVAADVTTEIQAGLATAAALTTVSGKIDTIDDFLDTEIAAILLATGTTLDDLVDDLETRFTAALAAKLTAHAAAVLVFVCASGSTTTTVVFSTVEGTTPSATTDFYKSAVICFTSGALAGQRTSISSYDGATKTATVVALTGAPANGVSGVIV